MTHVTATFDIPAGGFDRIRCAECAARACDALRQIPGVTKIECEEQRGTVQVDFDPARVSEADIRVELEHFGLREAERVVHHAWRVTGLD